jgi:hypothetical protein
VWRFFLTGGLRYAAPPAGLDLLLAEGWGRTAVVSQRRGGMRAHRHVRMVGPAGSPSRRPGSGLMTALELGCAGGVGGRARATRRRTGSRIRVPTSRLKGAVGKGPLPHGQASVGRLRTKSPHQALDRRGTLAPKTLRHRREWGTSKNPSRAGDRRRCSSEGLALEPALGRNPCATPPGRPRDRSPITHLAPRPYTITGKGPRRDPWGPCA